MTARTVTAEKAQMLLQSYQALHGIPKPVKGNEQGAVALIPFNLSGNARVVLNENVAALLSVTRPHDEAVETLRKQYKERLDEAKAAIADEESDEEACDKRQRKAETSLDAELNAEVVVMLAREKEIELQPLRRLELNETANPFFPIAFATLLNEGLIEGLSAKKSAA
jgi:DNA-binding transcriptional MocR family regulator